MSWGCLYAESEVSKPWSCPQYYAGGIWKRRFHTRYENASNVFRSPCARGILKTQTLVREIAWLSWRSAFSVHGKMKSGFFKFFQLKSVIVILCVAGAEGGGWGTRKGERSRTPLSASATLQAISWRIRVDGRSNSSNKAALSNFFSWYGRGLTRRVKWTAMRFYWHLYRPQSWSLVPI